MFLSNCNGFVDSIPIGLINLVLFHTILYLGNKEINSGSNSNGIGVALR